MLSGFLKTEISKTIGSDVRLKRFTLAFNRSSRKFSENEM